MVLTTGADASLHSCSFRRNSAGDTGGAVQVLGATLTVENTWIVGSRSEEGAAGIECGLSGDLGLHHLRQRRGI